MSNHSVLLSPITDFNQMVEGSLLPQNSGTMSFFDAYEPGQHGTVLSVTPKAVGSLQFQDGMFGDLRCISSGCVSDVTLFGADSSLASVDPSLLANINSAGIMESMNNEISFESLNTQLVAQLPDIQQALAGDMNLAQLSQLVADIQSQLLEINTLSQDIFGDVSGDVAQFASEAGQLTNEDLLASMQVDSVLFAEPSLAGFGSGSVTTLDGLFTSPESFPLTMDFSNPTSLQEASDLFASTGSSISSNASGIEGDSGLPGSGHGSDLG